MGAARTRTDPKEKEEAIRPLFAGLFQLSKGTDAANLGHDGVLGGLIGRLAKAKFQLLEFRAPSASAGNLAIAFNPSHASFVPCFAAIPVGLNIWGQNLPGAELPATTGSVSCSKTTE
jgi:hypothetical protein